MELEGEVGVEAAWLVEENLDDAVGSMEEIDGEVV